MSAVHKERMEARWQNCEHIANMLNHPAIQKAEVWTFYNTIVRRDWLISALSGNEETLEHIRQLPKFKYIVKQAEERKQLAIQPRIYKPKKGEVGTPAEQLGLAMWFIRKIGDPEQAKRAVNAAAAAIRELKKR
jgi:hypothetical protein